MEGELQNAGSSSRAEESFPVYAPALPPSPPSSHPLPRKGANSSFFGSGEKQAASGGERRLPEIPQRRAGTADPDIPPWLWKKAGNHPEEAGNHPDPRAGKVEIAPLLSRGSLGPSPFPAPPCLSFPLGADAFPPCPARPELLPMLRKALLTQLHIEPTPCARGRRIPALAASPHSPRLLPGRTDPTEPRLAPLPKNNLPKPLPAPLQREPGHIHGPSPSPSSRGDAQLQHNKTRKKVAKPPNTVFSAGEGCSSLLLQRNLLFGGGFTASIPPPRSTREPRQHPRHPPLGRETRIWRS